MSAFLKACLPVNVTGEKGSWKVLGQEQFFSAIFFHEKILSRAKHDAGTLSLPIHRDDDE